MAAPDDPYTPLPAEIPDDLATLRVTPPSPAAMPDDMQTIAVSKPVAAPPAEVAVMGANPDAAVPFVFGRRIAKGGMGAILEGDDRKLGRKIAVKVMLDSDASAEQTQRFVQEAAVLGRLEHPNIVPIHDLGRDSEGALYYTMKLVKGETLQHIIDRLRREDPDTLEHYTLDRLLLIFRKVCDALAFAHAQNIIHRDLKPENIMVGEFGEVLVMDWGIAKILGELGNEEAPAVTPTQFPAQSGTASFTATMDGAVMGTPNYMSPEQAMGKVNELDERSDIFSLGGILYAILTLRPPVEGKDVWEVLEKVQAANITSPTIFGATTTGKGQPKEKSEVLEAKKMTPLPHMPGGKVPSALSAVAMKALKLDKAKRYQQIAEFSADIEAFQGGYATSAEKISAFGQLALLIKRHKGASIAAAVAVVLITVLSVGFMFKVSHEKKVAEAEAVKARAAEAVAVQEKETSRKALARSAISLAESALRERNGTLMRTALGDVDEDLRDADWRYLFDQADSSVASLDAGTAEFVGGVADPTRPGVFALADSEHKITLMNVRTGERFLQFDAGNKAPSYVLKLAFSPDGKQIAIGTENASGNIAIHNSQDGKKLAGWDAPGTARLEFSPDGDLLLQTTLGHRTQLMPILNAWDPATGRLHWTFEGFSPTHAAFTPDGKQVVACPEWGEIAILSASDGSILSHFKKVAASAMAIHPDGRSLILALLKGGMQAIDFRNGKVLYETTPQANIVNAVRHLFFIQDGRRLVSVTRLKDGRHGIQVWDAATGSLRHSLLGGIGNIRDTSIHPFSGELAITGRNAKVYDCGHESWTLGVALTTPNQPAVFWGSDELLLGNNEGRFALHKLEKGKAKALWLPEATNFKHYVGASAAGEFAMAVRRASPSSVMLLRKSGSSVEVLNTFDMDVWLESVWLNTRGDKFLSLVGAGIMSSKDGSTLVSLDRKSIAPYPIHQLAWIHHDTQVLGIATAKNERGSSNSEEWIVVWDAATGKVLRTVNNATPMDVLAISADGMRFAEAGTDRKVRIRDTETLAIQQEFRAHDDNITGLVWHPTKPILATGSADLSIRLWDLDTGERLEELHGADSAPVYLRFSPGGIRLICIDKKATRIWEPRSLNEKPTAK